MKLTKFLITIITLPVILVMLKLLWAFTIPEIFPKAVEQELITATLSWAAAFKVAIFIFIVGILMSVRK